MKKNKTLKRLAEQHFFFGKTLNLKESMSLKNSIYSKVLNKNLNVLAESTEEHTSSQTSSKKRNVLRPGLNRNELLDLIDDVELQFNLDLSNPSPFKFREVNTIALKDFIRKYINTYFTDEDTLEHVAKIINRKDLKNVDILYRLYAAAGV